MAQHTKGLRRVRTINGCHAQSALGRAYRFYPAGSALPNEWDLGNGWSAVRHSTLPHARWMVSRVSAIPAIVPTLAAARAYVEGR